LRDRLVVRIGVVGIAFLALSFLGPWWEVSSQGSLFATSSWTAMYEFRPLSATVITQQAWVCCNLNTTTVVRSAYVDEPDVGLVFEAVSVLTVSALVSGAAMVALVAMRSFRVLLRRMGPILGFLASALTAAACLIAMAGLPGAASQDGVPVGPLAGFWGSTSFVVGHGSGASSWGPGWAWYEVVVAAVLFLMSGIAISRSGWSKQASGLVT
jgi:hypothetical protein